MLLAVGKVYTYMLEQVNFSIKDTMEGPRRSTILVNIYPPKRGQLPYNKKQNARSHYSLQYINICRQCVRRGGGGSAAGGVQSTAVSPATAAEGEEGEVWWLGVGDTAGLGQCWSCCRSLGASKLTVHFVAGFQERNI